MKRFSIVIILFTIYNVYCQSTNLDAESRAFLFHVVKKSPILNMNLGQAFEYDGPIIYFQDSTINYDSIEKIIIKQPEKLIIRNELIENAPKGLLSEIANKTAIWSLNTGLNDSRLNKLGTRQYLVEKYLIDFHEKISSRIKRHKSYTRLFYPDLSPLFNPGISLYDRDLLLQLIGFTDVNLRKDILEKQNESIVKVVESESRNIFKMLGGSFKIFDNVLMAAGDGSYTSGLLDEKEKDLDGNWNKGLPKAVGLFPYQLEILNGEVSPLRISSSVLENIQNANYTNLHFDVWGYNSNKQTTVIIEKNGKCYRLYGSSKTKFLSPDSTFSDGITIQKIINDIANNKYFNLLERFDETEIKINKINQFIEENRVKISSLEFEIENSKKNRFLKQDKKKLKDLKHKEIEYLDILNDLKLDLNEIKIPLNKIKSKLNFYESNLGLLPLKFTEKNGLYIYEDSTIFNLNTQEMIFTENNNISPTVVRLIAIPDDTSGNTADEVMLHVSRVDYNPYQFSDLQIELKDVFMSDRAQLRQPIKFKIKDSLKLAELILNIREIRPLQIELEGKGIGIWNNGIIIPDESKNSMNNYPGNTTEEMQFNKNSFAFSSLRRTNVKLRYDFQFHIYIESYTDPVKSNFKPKNEWENEAFQNDEFSKNDLLSAYRTLFILKEIKIYILSIAKKVMDENKYDEFESQFEWELKNSTIKVNGKFYKLNKFSIM